MIGANYTAEGLRALQRDKASGRRQAVTVAIEGVGGKLEAAYFSLGEDDVYLIVDMPDNASVAGLAIAVSAGGLARTRTTALMTVEEVDQALAKSVNYRAPGH